MACMCPVIALGWVALAYIGYRLFKAVSNVVYPYKLAAPIDLKKAAGAEWAVVTGSTDGIGLAYAKELARKGFKLLLISRTQAKLDDVKKVIEDESKVEVKTIAYDFTNPSMADYEQKLIQAFNELDIGILVNNVGLSYEYPDVLHKIEGGLKRVADITVINTVPPTVLSAAVLPKMVERRSGIIVNIASSAAANPMSMWAVYSATKKYVCWLSEILRMEYSSKNITIQTICPMLVATKMSKVSKTNFFTPSPEKFVKEAVRSIGNAEETSGCFSHQIQVEISNIVPQPIVNHFLTKMSVATRAKALRKKERLAAQKDE
uniref:Estradiol 17-beta-dehydrogenase 12 n=1 Tax=Steinernema glaseri TaxID=37863 RepID=A0A1I8A513_9BILA